MQLASIENCRSVFGSFAARCLLTAVCLHSTLSSAAAAQSRGPLATGSIAFDIPAQPLDQALEAFGAASGLQIFYENILTNGHRSTAVKGVFTPRAALQILLWGSGLTARVIAVDTISVAKPPDAALAKRQTGHAYLPYYGVLQAGIMKALCASAETRLGAYHIALQYWINPAGRIARFKLLGSSGNDERDKAVMTAMQGLVLPPPLDMPQPVTMAIEPTRSAACAPSDARGP